MNTQSNSEALPPTAGSPRQTFHCDFGIRSIQKGKKGKPATMTVEIHNDLADKLMKAVTGIGPKIYGPVIEWQEDAPGNLPENACQHPTAEAP